jgi:hypothetical protein
VVSDRGGRSLSACNRLKSAHVINSTENAESKGEFNNFAAAAQLAIRKKQNAERSIMAFSVHLISHPSPGVFEFLRQRVGAVGKKILSEAEVPFSAVGLIQGKVVDMIAAADVAEKAASVRVFDLKGICPQHVTMIGIFGDIADVKASLKAIEEAEHLK